MLKMRSLVAVGVIICVMSSPVYAHGEAMHFFGGDRETPRAAEETEDIETIDSRKDIESIDAKKDIETIDAEKRAEGFVDPADVPLKDRYYGAMINGDQPSDVMGQTLQIREAKYLQENYIRICWDSPENSYHVRISVSTDRSFVDAYTVEMPDFGEALVCPWEDTELVYPQYCIYVASYAEDGTCLGSDTCVIDGTIIVREAPVYIPADNVALDEVVEQVIGNNVDGVSETGVRVNAEHSEATGEGKVDVVDTDGQEWEITIIAERKD